ADTARLSMFANRFHPGKFEFTDRRASSPEVERRKEIVAKLNALRRECRPLSEGSTEWIATENEKVLAFKRVSEDGEIIFIGNFSSKAEDLKLDLESKETLLSNNCEINENAVSLAGYGYAIIKSR
ncbi:MAG: alpha-glucosidase C-terminal domain-containing protein, partial [Clostridia bacterium]|nr:alpha-glucosidase C-terminal domain-containing protein [Clostridia bacterium]